MNYTQKIGEAGEKYIASVAYKGCHDLPALFRWSDLWDAMLSAALTAQPEAQETVAWGESYDGGKFFNTVSLTKTKHHTFPLYANPVTHAPVEAGLRESLAKLVYDRGMLFMHEGKPAWVERGNSIAQTEARRIVDEILAAINAQSA